MEMEVHDVCGCLVFLKPNKPLSANSSKYLLRYGDVVRIGSKEGDDIRLKHLTDLKTDAVLIIAEETGFVQATNPEYAETLLNDSRLSAPKYLLPGDQLQIKGKIFMYDANLSAEDIVLLKGKNQDGSIRQVPKKRHSVMIYSRADMLKKDEHEELPIPEPTVFVRDGFQFQAEYLPTPLTPSKSNYVATTPRMRKLSIKSELPKTANNILAKRKKSLRRYSMDLSSRSISSPFLRLRRSFAPSPKQVFKSLTDDDLIDWNTPPMTSASFVDRKSMGLPSRRKSSYIGNVSRRSTRNSTVNETFEKQIAVRKSSIVGRQSLAQTSMVEESSSPILTTGRMSASITRWSTSNQNITSNNIPDDDDEDVVFVESHRLSNSFNLSIEGSPVMVAGRKSRSSTIGRQSINRGTNNSTIGDIEDGHDEESVMLEACTSTGDKGRRSTKSRCSLAAEERKDLNQVEAPYAMPSPAQPTRRQSRVSAVPNQSINESIDNIVEETPQVERFLPKIGRKSATSTVEKSSRSSFVHNFDGSYINCGSPAPSSGRKSTAARLSGKSWVENKASEDDSDVFEDEAVPEEDNEEEPSALDESVRTSGRKSGFQKSNVGENFSEFYEQDLEEEPATISERRSMRSSKISGSNSTFEAEDREEYTTESPLKLGRMSASLRRSARDQTGEFDPDESSISDGNRKSTTSQRTSLPQNATSEDFERPTFDASGLEENNSISERSTRHQRSALSKTLNDFERKSPRQTCVGRKSLPSTNIRSHMSSSVVGRQSSLSRMSGKSQIQEESQDYDSLVHSPTKGRKSAVLSPVVGRESTSRRSTRSEIASSNTTAEEDLAESYETQTVPRKSIGRMSVTSNITSRAARSEIRPSNKREEFLDESQDIDQEDSFSQSPAKGRRSAVSTVSRRSIVENNPEESFSRTSTSAQNRRSTKNQLETTEDYQESILGASSLEEQDSDRRSSLHLNVQSPRHSVTGISDRSLEIIDVDVSNVASPVVDRKSTMSRRSTRSVEESNESICEEVSATRPTLYKDVLSKTLNYLEGQSPRNSVGRKSAPSTIAGRSGRNSKIIDVDMSDAESPVFNRSSTMSRRSARTSEIIDVDMSDAAAPVVDRRSMISRRSTRNVILGSSDQEKPADDSVFEVEVSDKPSRSQNVLSKTLNDFEAQSPKTISVGRKSAPSKMARRSDKIVETLDLDLANVASPVVDRSTYSRRATRSLINPSDNTINDLDEEKSTYHESYSDQDECPTKSTGRDKSTVSTLSRRSRHSVIEIQESPDVNAASTMGSRGSPVPSSIGSQFVEEQETLSAGDSTRKSMRNQNENLQRSYIREQVEERPESPVLSSSKFDRRSSRGSSQSPLKLRQSLQESIIMGSPDLSANKRSVNGRSSLKLPQYDDVTMEEEDAEAANNSDQENSEDEINISGIRRLQKSPNNDLTDVAGVKHLFTGPTKTPKLDGIKAIFNHERSPKNDLTDIAGVKKLFTEKSPLNDLSNIAPGCVKQVFRVGPYNSYSQIENLKDVFRRSPRNELMTLGGVNTIFKNNAPREVPDTPDLQQVRMFKTPKTLRKTAAASFAEKLDDEPIVSPKGAMPSNDSFDNLVGKPAYRTYKPKDIHGSPSGNRKIMNDSLSETFDSIKKKRKLSKTPKPIGKEVLGVLDISDSQVDLEEAAESQQRLSLDLFNAKKPENLLGDPLEETPGKIIKNTSTPLPTSTSRTRSKRNLMTSVEPKEQSIAKDEQPQEAKPARQSRRNLASIETPQEEKPEKRTRRNLASTETPENPTISQKGKKIAETKTTVKSETSKPSRSRRNQTKETLVDNEEDLVKPDTPIKSTRASAKVEENNEPKRSTRTRRNAKPLDKQEKEEDKSDLESRKDESAEEPLVVTEKLTKRRKNAKKVDKVVKEEELKSDLESGKDEVTNNESAEEPPVVTEKPTRSRRIAKKVGKEIQKNDLESGKDEVTNDKSAEEPPVIKEKLTRGRKNSKNENNVEKEEHAPLPNDDTAQMLPAVAKPTRGRRKAKQNLNADNDIDMQKAAIAKDDPVENAEHIQLPKEESPAKPTRGRRNAKKNLDVDKDAKHTPIANGEPVQETQVISARPTRGRKNAKKVETSENEPPKEDMENDEKQASVAKDEPAPKTSRTRKNAAKDNLEIAVTDKPKPRSRRNANKMEDTKNEEQNNKLDLESASEELAESKTSSKRGTQRGKTNAKEIKFATPVNEEEEVEEKKVASKRTNRQVRFVEERIKEDQDNSEDDEEEKKPTRGKRVTSRKIKAVEPDTEEKEIQKESEEAVPAAKVKRGAKRNATHNVAEEVESHPAKKGKVVKKETAPAKKSSKRNQAEEVVVEETQRKSKRLRK